MGNVIAGGLGIKINRHDSPNAPGRGGKAKGFQDTPGGRTSLKRKETKL